MDDHRTDWIDALARKCPTALAMALERAIAANDPDLERAVLEALGQLGIVVVDRGALIDALATVRRKRPGRSGPP